MTESRSINVNWPKDMDRRLNVNWKAGVYND